MPSNVTLVSRSPADYAGKVDAKSSIVLTFSGPVQAGTGTVQIYSYGKLLLSESMNSSVVTISGNTVTIDPPQDLPFASEIRVSFTDGWLVDSSGVALSVPYYYSFTTGLSPVALNVKGSDARDLLHGSELADRLDGGGGDDELWGHGGNDVLLAGESTPYSYGDRLHGGDGDDTLIGSTGNDNLAGDAGNDNLQGGAGNDVLDGGSGNNILLGGSGNDELRANGGGNDRLEGGAGDDQLMAGSGIAVLAGDAGNDRFDISPYSGDTGTNQFTLAGGDGDDNTFFRGSYGSYTANASGGAGRDTYAFSSLVANKITIADFAVGSGGDRIELVELLPYGFQQNPFGANGYARLVQSGQDTILQVDRDGAAGTAYTWRDLATFSNTSAAAFTRDNFVQGFSPAGGNVGLSLTGSEANDSLRGYFLDDTLDGLGGDDSLDGEAGNDLLRGGDGDDRLTGGAGDDQLFGGAGADTLSDAGGNNLLDGGAGDDRIEQTGGGSAQLLGGDGKDFIGFGVGSHTVDGGNGDDTIYLHPYNDYGGTGANSTSTASGGDGDDTFILQAERKADVRLYGGAGIDTYRLAGVPQDNRYEVMDFRAGSGGDRIEIERLLGYGRDVINPFGAGGTLRLAQEGAHTVLYWDSDGAGEKQFQAILTLANVQVSAVTGANFVGGYAPDGSLFASPLTGTDQDDQLNGNRLHDTIDGAGGDDNIEGNDGNDTLRGDAGKDRLRGGAGNDLLDGGLDDDVLYDSEGSNTLRGGAGDDLLQAGSSGTNLLEGGAGKDRLYGGNGADTLDGGDGDDRLVVDMYGVSAAGQRVVKMFGGAGDDTFGLSNHHDYGLTLEATGGAGADLFQLGSGWAGGSIVVLDFDTAGGDRLALLEALRMNTSFEKANPFAEGVLKLVQSGQDTQVVYVSGGTDKVWLTLKNTNAASLTYTAFREGTDPRAAAGALDITGSAGADRIISGNFNDQLAGGAGDDVLSGAGGSDVLLGGEGLDRLTGGDGDDLLDGGAGLDFMHIARSRGELKVWAENGGFKVQDLVGNGGTDTLLGIERIQLTGSVMALDINGVGGQVYRLYQAAFDRKPDMQGAGYWIYHADRGVSLMDIAAGFIGSTEFKTLYGEAPTNQQLVDRLYRNVLHREPDAEGRAYWLDVLDRKLAPLSSVLVGFSESSENATEVAKLIGTGFEYSAWLG